MPSYNVVLPDAEQMMESLKGVMDEPHAVEKLYPRICRDLAGQEKAPEGVCLTLSLALKDYVESLPPVMAPPIYMFAENFIEAIVPDEDACSQALAVWKEATGTH